MCPHALRMMHTPLVFVGVLFNCLMAMPMSNTSLLPEGRYAIKRAKSEFLTDTGGKPHDPAVLDGFHNDTRFYHQWLITNNADDGTVNIRSAELPVFLSVNQTWPGNNAQVQMASERQRWQLVAGKEAGQYFIQLPRGEMDAVYVVDVSDEAIRKPNIVLRHKSTEDEHQTWDLHAVIRP
ncbi:hypothetical protein BGZ70_000445 [Mortierella alpina]|uniref:Ricin B lectin domain-containing protein n=1 Tax=Mortierella alpina TaxID=64518 RepID=A0A9P6LZ23_MORAP|nr:hypothetical protein BGZ70_000445 [Mortierella alpina]